MNRILMMPDDNQMVDHRNHDTLDNRRSNLRICTNAQNQQNRQATKGGKSEYKGVTWHNQNKNWCARITINNKRKYLGSFQDEKEAALAYDTMAKKYFGEYARLNFRG